ncbi:hypothetical protein QQS21_001278 [Conoideocrella luteorostrata]|uniref:Peptidase S33 tripeptidyl aminopeptidase-like C-terminal domain-containing protein n=1 Tax=Conoideocrella luteorostrata TaxID=1105319 RepID=A0AAJ0G3H1_9HYPO|nr:hypothetical protein QQS21_001278 [Conoideocrella luteorostrata]
MSLKHLLSALSLASLSAANFPRLDLRADATIKWSTCDPKAFNTTLTSDCANFTVPLDYTSPNATETIVLELARIKAPIQPAKGTILLNFGGPGSPGRSELAGQASTLLALSGNEYNLAAFDPRATANTIPEICFKTQSEQRDFIKAQTWYDLNGTTLASMWKRATVNSDMCYEAHKKTQPFVGTAFVARDLISVVDALGEDGMLRYWGFSYGTTLGATVAAMFPDRIDKLVIDGVQNPHQYYHANADYEEWTDSDRVFAEVFRSCEAAGPKACPMAVGNLTAVQMETAAWNIAEKLKTAPIPVNGSAPLDYTVMRGFFAYAVYGPSTWPSLSALLTFVASNQTNSPEFVKTYNAMYKGLILGPLPIYPALYAIHCSDRIPRLQTVDEFRPVQARLSKTSKVMDGASTDLSMVCAQWKTDAVERYLGDFHAKTKNPILVASNKYDGHTPLVSAHNVSSGFAGSGLLVVNGFGHTTLSQPSICTIKNTAAYWHNGTFPAKDFVCDVDGAPYSNYSWKDAINAVYGVKSNNSGQGAPGSQTPPPTNGGGIVDYKASNLVSATVISVLVGLTLL